MGLHIEEIESAKIKVWHDAVKYEALIELNPFTLKWDMELIDKGEIVDTATRNKLNDVLTVATYCFPRSR